MSFVAKADVPARTNSDLREGRLRAALVAPDGTIIKLLEKEDWQSRTVRVPLNPAEGVAVEPPYEEGRVYIWSADLDEWYPANPATSTTVADRQLSPISKLDAWVAEHGPALTGSRPKEGWNKFYDRCRDDCDGWADKKNGKPAADFSNKTIERRLQHAGFKLKPDR